MTKQVLVNRPEKQADETVKFLMARGIPAFVCPSTAIEFKPPTPQLDAQFLVVTSANSLEFLRNQRQDILLIVVGKPTAEHAKDQGFTNIQYAEGDSISLIALIKRLNLNIDNGVLISGSDPAGKPYGENITLELGIKQMVAYQVKPLTSLSGESLEILKSGEISTLLIYSKQNAENFLDLASSYLADIADQIDVICLAENIKRFWNSKSQELGIKKWGSITVSMPPHEAL